MNHHALIDSLARIGRAVPLVVDGVSEDDARWRPEDGAWSILEIVTHLADEEVEDFRRRLELTLEDPALPWPPIDPEGAAVERRYNEGDLGAVTARFVTERGRSLEWLRGLEVGDWTARHEHPLGPLAAGDLLAAWAAHDALHLRQLSRRLFQLISRDAAPFTSRYAGQWPA